jgi:hypothetical protein
LAASLTPILVAGTGRSGTTMLMALLGTDARVAFDRVYPFENRYLTYYAKFAFLSGRPGRGEEADGTRFAAFDTDVIGAPPWPTEPPPGVRFLAPEPTEMLRRMWGLFSEQAGAATHYAEKARAWLTAYAREALPCHKVDLVRDPRDIYLSTNSFNRKRGFLAFGRRHGDSDLNYARRLAAALLLYFENQRADRGRPDCSTVRYEDLILDRQATVRRLNQELGLQLSLDADVGHEHLPIHKTSTDVAASVERWKREPLPPEARAFLESHLAEALRWNGYDVPPETPAPNHMDLATLDRISPHGSVARTDEGGLSIAINGDDFWAEFKTPAFNAARVPEIWLCLRGDTGQHNSLYWRRAGESFDEGRSVHLPFVSGKHWQLVRLRPAGHPHWHGQIIQLRIDFMNGPKAAGHGELRWMRLVE